MSDSMPRDKIEQLFSEARTAQIQWRQCSVLERTKRIARISALLVENRLRIGQAIVSHSRQDFRETITSEIFPLADTAKWLHRRAHRVLAPRRQQSGTPRWLGRLRSTVYRDPFGLVLILGTGNYPLFLPGAQVLHALAAGNAVVIKPAPNCEKITMLLLEILSMAGVPMELTVMLDSSVDSATTAMQCGVDLTILTGSHRTGQAVLRNLSESVTPAVMELSGCDSVFLLRNADMQRVCDLIVFGLRLNGGATCMAPRRVFVQSDQLAEFQHLLCERLESPEQFSWKTRIPSVTARQLDACLQDAIKLGASILSAPQWNPASRNLDSEIHEQGHVVITNVRPEMRICSVDLFAPLTMIVPVSNIEEAILANESCPYALTSAIFGPAEEATQLAQRITAGFVSVNDLIVPTADPSLPFGGRKASGYGVTRGEEGLLGMTTPKVISHRIGRWLPHANLPHPSDEALLDGLLQLSHHQRLGGKVQGLMQMMRAVLERNKRKDG